MKYLGNNKTIAGFIYVLTGAICFSAKAIMVKLSFRYGIDAVSLLVLRMVFSFPFFLTIALWTNSKRPSQNISTTSWLQLIVMGFIGYYLASIFDFTGLKYITANLERLILFIYPTFVVLFNRFFFKKLLSYSQMMALLFTYTGIIIAFKSDDILNTPEGWKGAFFIFMSAITYAIYLIGSGRLIPLFGSLNYTCWAMIVSTIVSIMHFFIFTDIKLLSYSKEVYLLALSMAIFSTVIPSFLVSKGISLIGSSAASIVGSIGPVCTIILSHLFLGENMNMYQWIGALLVLIGIGFVSKN